VSPSKQKSKLEKKLKKVRKQLSSVDNNLRSLSRTVEDPGTPAAEGAVAPDREGPRPNVTVDGGRLNRPGQNAPRHLPRGRSQEHDTRFISYLASGGLESARPLRREKHTQRNKAVVMSVFALLVLVWVLFRFVLRP